MNIFRIFRLTRLFNLDSNQKIEVNIKEEIEKLHQQVINRYMLLNQAAPTWLLLGTIGCWGIPFLILRLLAAWLLLCVFFDVGIGLGHRKDGRKESFPKTANRIEKK